MSTAWEKRNQETVFQKYSRRIERREYTLPNGEVSDYYILVAGATACVLALTEGDKVVTIKQYRPGPDKVLNELPGGFVDEGEEPTAAAMRELKEETGYVGRVVWTGQWQSDAYTDQDRYVVVAKDCRKMAEPKLEADEFGEVELVGIDDFIGQARAGMSTDAAGALLGLDHLKLLGRS